MVPNSSGRASDGIDYAGNNKSIVVRFAELHAWEVHPRVNATVEAARRERPPPRTPTMDADPSPTGQSLPAPPTTVPPSLPTPIADVGGINTGTCQGAHGGGRSSAPAEQGGGRIDAQGEGRDVAFGALFGQSEAIADRADVQNQGVSVSIERDARIADLQRRVSELQQQNNLQNDLRTPTVSTEAYPGVIPRRWG